MRKYSRKNMKKRRNTHKKRGGRDVKIIHRPSLAKPGVVLDSVLVFDRYDDKDKYDTFLNKLGKHIRTIVIDTEEGLIALSSHFRDKEKEKTKRNATIYGFETSPGN